MKINPKQEAILARLVYSLTFMLKKRFPSIKVRFYKPPGGKHLVFHVEVLETEDSGDRSVNPMLATDAGHSIDGVLSSVGIAYRTESFSCDDVSLYQGGVQGGMSGSIGDDRNSHTRWLQSVSGGFEEIIRELGSLLPEIPSGQPVPAVLFS